MKRRLIFAVGLLAALLLSCQMSKKLTTSSGRGSIQIDEHSIMIPGNAISDPDREALEKIFQKYDTSLYRIAAYKKGSRTKQIGTMDEMQVGVVAKEYAESAKARGLTNWTNKIGNITHVTTTGNPSHVTTAGNPSHVTRVENTTHVTTESFTSHTTHNLNQDSDALVKEVTPILEKYSK